MTVSEASKDEVLVEFERDCPVPTEANLAEWQRLHPQYAYSLARAALRRTPEDPTRAAATAAIVEAVLDRHMRDLYPEGMPRPLNEKLADANVTVDAVAGRIGFGAELLSVLVRGDLMHPIGYRVLRAFADALNVSMADVSHAVTAAIVAPRSVHARAGEAPDFATVSWAEAVAASSLTDEQKAFLTETAD